MRNRHRLKSIYTCVLLAMASPAVSANPLDPTVVSGQASFATTGNTLTVTNTPGTIINWQGFSIGANEITRFNQQSAASAVLNRVISSNPSSIMGAMQSNGRVFLINPNGIVFGAGSVVDVAGLVASTLNLSDADFLAGRSSFTQVPGAASISNAGNITASGDGQTGGQIFLIAPNVENTGVITAANGEILLAAGHSVDLVDTSDPNLRVNITAPAGDATNVGQLIASSGSLGLFGTMVRNSGAVSADSATLQGGKIVFKASLRAEIGGTVSANGTTGGDIQIQGNQVALLGNAKIDASGANGGGTVLVGGDAHGANPNVQNAQDTYVDATATIKADATQNGNGGKVVVWSDNATQFNGNISSQGGAISGNGGWVEVSGKQKLGYAGLTNTLAAKGLSGNLLLDPADFLILPSGGDMTGATLSANLGAGNVTIITAVTGGMGATGTLGDIYVSDAVSWATTSTLTLNSYGIIALNSAITAASGSLISNAGVGGLSTAYIVDVGNLQLASLVANAPAGGTGTTLTGINTLGALDVQSGGVTGTGMLNVSGGATTLTDTLAVNTLNITGGTLSLDGATTTTLPTLNLSSGTLTGTGNIVIPNSSAMGIFNWTGGTLSGTGTFSTTPGSPCCASSFQPTATTMNGTLTLSRPFNNLGVMSQGAGPLTLTVTPLGSLMNTPTAGQAGGMLILGNGATGGSIIVNGTLSNLGELGAFGTGVSSVDASGATIGTISNGGTVGVAAGTAINAGATLNWTAGQTTTNTGTWGIGAIATPTFGGVLNLGVAAGGGAQTYSGAFTNVGTVNVNSGTNTITGAFTNNGALQFGTLAAGTNSYNGAYSEAQLAGGFAPSLIFTSGTNAFNSTVAVPSIWTLYSNGGFNTFDTTSTITNLDLGAGSTLTGLGSITVSTTGGFNWSGGTLATTGTGVNAATITLNNTTIPTTLMQGTLNLNRALINNGVVSQQSVNGGTTTTLYIGDGGSFTNNGTFDLGNGAGLTANTGTVNVSDTGTFTNSAAGIINSAGTVTNTIQAVLGTTVGTVANNGAINVAADNTLNYLGGQTATNAGSFATVAGGVLNLGAGVGVPAGAAYTYGGTITNDGALNFIGGMNNLTGTITGTGIATVPVGVALNVTVGTLGSPLVNNGALNFSGVGNSVTGTLTQNGLLVVAPGATLAAPSFTNAGTLAGGGVLNLGAGTLTNNGIIAPSGTGITGTLSITGNLVMATGSSLMLDINGTTAGQYDVLNVSGTADLTSGTLNLYGVGGAMSYTVLTAGGLVGTFGTINSGTFTQTPTYNPTNVTLGVTANSVAGFIYWTGGAGTNNWADLLNWSSGAVPILSDNLYINPSAKTVFITAGAQSGNNLFCDANLNLAGGSLALAGNLNLPGTFTVSGGTWNQVAVTLPAFNVGDFSITGGTFIRALGGDGTTATPYLLTDIYGVQGMASAGMLGNSYVLANNIDATGTANWNAGAGSLPIGDFQAPFTGQLNGQGNTISNLSINRPATNSVGLFGMVGVGGVVSNVGLLNGTVIGGSDVGMLAGINEGSITASYATLGLVSSGGSTGGLVGRNGFDWGSLATLSNSYSSSITVNGYSSVGGLVGDNYGAITNSYSSGGTVSGVFGFGGLVGGNWGAINTSYSTNAVAVGGGGLTGWDEMWDVNNSYWDIQTSGSATSGNPNDTGLTTAQMMTMASFAGWSIANTGGTGVTWRIYEGHTTPLLTSFLTPLILTDAPDVTVFYNGFLQSGGTTGSGVVLGAAASGTNAGFYNGYYSTQLGYDIDGGNLTITAVSLSVISLNGTRAYDGTAIVDAGIFSLGGLINGENLILSGAGTVADANVGINKPVTLGTLLLGDDTGLASNYTLTGGTHTATITAAPLTITGSNVAGKVYDGTTSASVTEGGLSGLMGIEMLGVSASGAFADKNVGTAKNVSVTYTLADGTGLASNYSLAGETLTADITALPVTLTAPSLNRTYNGGVGYTPSAAELTTLSGGLVGGDVVAAANFTYADKNAATNKTVSFDSVALNDGNGGLNYTVTLVGNSTSTITQALLTVTANATSKILNTTDPLLTYTVSGLQFTDTTATTLNGGSLVRVAGETVGTYQINEGSLYLSMTGQVNYTWSYVPANFTILVPTVIDEIVNTSLMFSPDSGSARSTSSKDEEDKAKEDILAVVDTKPVDGAAAQPLPVCN